MRQKALALTVMLFFAAVAISADSDELIIEETYDAWVKAANAKDIESWSSFLAPSAFFVPPGVPPLETEVAILNFYKESFADPVF